MMNCGTNEIYSGCGNDGCQRRCDRLDVTGCIPSCGTPACICEEGFVRDSIGTCIPISECRKLTSEY